MQSFKPILDRIKSIKAQKGFTNEMLAKKSGIPLGTLSKILSSVIKDPKIGALISITDALDVDINSLIYSSDLDDQVKLSLQEKNLIKKYRALDERGRKTIDTLLNYEYSLKNYIQEGEEILSDKDIDDEVENYRLELVAERGGDKFNKAPKEPAKKA